MRKTNKIRLLSVLLALALALCALPALGCAKAADKRTAYTIEADFSLDEMVVRGKMKVDYYNAEETTLGQLCFHLYGNAYREDAKYQPVSASAEPNAFPTGKDVYGKTEVSAVTAAGEAAQFEIAGEDQNVLIVPLAEELYPAERVEIGIDFVLTLSHIQHRLGYGDDTINLGNWYPVACHYGREGFLTDPYYSNGDPFCSDVADYFVTFTAPKALVCAFGGDVVEKSGDTIVTYKVEAKNVRDFAAVLSTKFEVLSDYAGGNATRVDYYYYDDPDAAAHLKLAIDCIETFGDLFGKYPYATYTVVKNDFCHGGMEYPRLVYISDRLTGDDYDETIVHETAHQWWYGLVGNDEVREAFLDEGLADYSVALFYEKHPTETLTYDGLVKEANSSYKLFERMVKEVNGNFNPVMNRSLKDFRSEYEYVVMTYRKGMMLFAELREAVGDDAFFKGLKRYYAKNLYKIATLGELKGAMSVKADVSGFIDSFVEGKAML